jgi:hypothetical protein
VIFIYLTPSIDWQIIEFLIIVFKIER